MHTPKYNIERADKMREKKSATFAFNQAVFFFGGDDSCVWEKESGNSLLYAVGHEFNQPASTVITMNVAHSMCLYILYWIGIYGLYLV